jgi:hypothetical protein
MAVPALSAGTYVLQTNELPTSFLATLIIQ